MYYFNVTLEISILPGKNADIFQNVRIRALTSIETKYAFTFEQNIKSYLLLSTYLPDFRVEKGGSLILPSPLYPRNRFFNVYEFPLMFKNLTYHEL